MATTSVSIGLQNHLYTPVWPLVEPYKLHEFIGECQLCSLNKTHPRAKSNFFSPKVTFRLVNYISNGTLKLLLYLMVHFVALRWYMHIVPSCCVCTLWPHVAHACCALMLSMHVMPSCCALMFSHVVPSACVLMYTLCPHVVHACCVLLFVHAHCVLMCPHIVSSYTCTMCPVSSCCALASYPCRL